MTEQDRYATGVRHEHQPVPVPRPREPHAASTLEQPIHPRALEAFRAMIRKDLLDERRRPGAASS